MTSSQPPNRARDGQTPGTIPIRPRGSVACGPGQASQANNQGRVRGYERAP